MRSPHLMSLAALAACVAAAAISASPARAETTPPTCPVSAVTGPPKQATFTIQDTGSGLASIVVTRSDNADTPVPPFFPGTTSPITVTSTKINQSQPMKIER